MFLTGRGTSINIKEIIVCYDVRFRCAYALCLKYLFDGSTVLTRERELYVDSVRARWM